MKPATRNDSETFVKVCNFQEITVRLAVISDETLSTATMCEVQMN